MDDSKDWLDKTKKKVMERFSGEEGSHDWHHIDRVRRMALQLCTVEGGDPFIVEMAALLHDMEDWKLDSTDNRNFSVREWLVAEGMEKEQAEKILTITGEVSFRGMGVITPCSSLESMIVQDADRLDAIGAIGIARAFAYGGREGRPLHVPGEKPVFHSSFGEYRNHKGSTVQHFHEKLLALKDRCNTGEGRRIAAQRHEFMVLFLDHFFRDWYMGVPPEDLQD